MNKLIIGKMKKTLFCLALMAMCSVQSVLGGVVVDDPLVDESSSNNGRPRSVVTTVNAFSNENCVEIDVNRYVGNAHVYVIASDSTCQTCSTYYINGHSNFTMDFSDLNDGSYTLRVVLDNGTSFSGNLVKN